MPEEVERHIIKERNVTAIVRENSTDMVRRWDNDIMRLKREFHGNMRMGSIQLALQTLRDDPAFHSFVVNRETEEEPPRDYWAQDVLPLAERIYEHITKHEEL